MTNKFKVGDFVKVTRKSTIEEDENDINSRWIEPMDEYIGKTYEITAINQRGYVLNDDWTFPECVLEKPETITFGNNALPWIEYCKTTNKQPSSNNMNFVYKDKGILKERKNDGTIQSPLLLRILHHLVDYSLVNDEIENDLIEFRNYIKQTYK